MDTEDIKEETVDAAIAEAWEQEDTHPVETRDTEEPADGQEPAREADSPSPELFTLKNRDEIRRVTREEMTAMAQKGWDYDTVRRERDQLRQYREESSPAVKLVADFAARSGMGVPEYLDSIRRQELMGRGMDEQTAQNAVRQERQQQRTEAAARRKDMNAFLNQYAEVKPEEIPKEVWAEVAGGNSLVGAYTMYRNRQLQAELDAERQNSRNRRNAPGSLGKSAGRELSEQDRIWYSDD